MGKKALQLGGVAYYYGSGNLKLIEDSGRTDYNDNFSPSGDTATSAGAYKNIWPPRLSVRGTLRIRVVNQMWFIVIDQIVYPYGYIDSPSVKLPIDWRYNFTSGLSNLSDQEGWRTRVNDSQITSTDE